MFRTGSLVILGALLIATGCAGKDSVLFVTTTQIGIDADTKPANISIGYDRYEGYLGPVYETGAIPAVVARLDSNLAVFNPEIRQVYATGDAAKLVTQRDEASEEDFEGIAKATCGEKKLAFVSTGTNIGLKLAFAGQLPESISFGYKRKELSLIPLIKAIDGCPVVEGLEAETTGTTETTETEATSGEETYASVLASIDMRVKTRTPTDTALPLSQFFATGIAAEQLAGKNREIREAFWVMAEQAITRDGSFLKDAAGDKLRKFWKPDGENIDPDNDTAIREWMENNGLDPTSITFFMRVDYFADARIKAVEDLDL
jgi:hypothetical protein